MGPLLRVLLVVMVAGCTPYAYGPGPNRAGHEGQWRIPSGSYRQTCRGVRLDGWFLKATCQRRNGIWRNTALDLRGCDRAVVNEDGRLRCGGDGGASNIPPGSYARSCTDIRVQRGMLRCECRGDDGRWHRNERPVQSCRRFANRNGRLACE